MPRIILTLAQARDLQQQIGVWPDRWHFLLSVPTPELPDMIIDQDREDAALKMMEMGCADDQIAKQLNWKAPNMTIRPLRRMFNMMKRKMRQA